MNPELRDTIKETNSAVFILTLNKAGQEPISRTITLEYIDFDGSGDVKDNIGSFRSLLLGKYNKFFQPSGWRDDNRTESEWTTTAVKAKVINKSEAELDFPD